MPNIIEVDKSSLKFWQLQLIRFNNFFCMITLFAINNFIRAWQGDDIKNKTKKYYNSKTSDKFFTKDSNFLFDQLTYRQYYGMLDKMFNFFVQSPKIIHTHDSIFIFNEINKNASENNIKQQITAIDKIVGDLRKDNEIYFINRRGFVVKSLVNSYSARLHKILIKKAAHLASKNNPFFIKHAEEIVHIFNEEDYYLVINRLLNPTEFHHYLLFRRWQCQQKPEALDSISEASMLGQYLSDKKDDLPDNRYAIHAMEFDIGLKYWEIFFSSLYKSVGSLKTFELDYAFVLNRIAKLKLDELILLNDTFKNHVHHVIQHADNLKSEIHILLPFGFVFIENFHKELSQVSDHYRCALKAYCIERQLPACIALIIEPTKDKNNALGCEIKWWIFVNDTRCTD